MPDGDSESQSAYEDVRGSVRGSFKASLECLGLAVNLFSPVSIKLQRIVWRIC